MNSSMRGYYGKSAGSSFFGDQMRASNKKSDLMEYDMKTNKIVEVRPQAKDPNDDDWKVSKQKALIGPKNLLLQKLFSLKLNIKTNEF